VSATPYTLTPTPARRIVGLPLRTDNTRAFETIPAHWQRFMGEAVPGRIAGACGPDLYAVYANFENLDVLAGGDITQLRYTLLIGLEVPAGSAAPEGLQAVDLPAQTCAAFAVPSGQPQQVGAHWQQIWARNDLARAFVADAERYQPDGRIDILVGLR
jgi:predicted transcriptional regulator YdeE